jgi:alpha-N-arabinofuranosidase
MPSWCANRAFLDDAASPAHWAAVQGDGAAATIALDKSEPLNDTIRTSLRLDVTQASTDHAAGVANEGYWGIPVKPNTRYRASVYAKAAAGFTGPIAVSIQSIDGKTIYASGRHHGRDADVEAVRVDAPDTGRHADDRDRYVLAVERPARFGSASSRCSRLRSRISRTVSGPTSCR